MVLSWLFTRRERLTTAAAASGGRAGAATSGTRPRRSRCAASFLPPPLSPSLPPLLTPPHIYHTSLYDYRKSWGDGTPLVFRLAPPSPLAGPCALPVCVEWGARRGATFVPVFVPGRCAAAVVALLLHAASPLRARRRRRVCALLRAQCAPPPLTSCYHHHPLLPSLLCALFPISSPVFLPSSVR